MNDPIKIKTNHGGEWTLTEDPCDLGGPSTVLIRAEPDQSSGYLASCLMIPEWNGWRLRTFDDTIDIPIQVVEALMSRVKQLTNY